MSDSESPSRYRLCLQLIICCHVRLILIGDAWNGAIAFGLLDQTNPASEIDMIIMMNTDGQLQYSHISSGDYDVEPISQDTLMYTGSGYIWRRGC